MTPPLDPHLATDAERRQQIALFRYGLIADLVQLPTQHRGLYKLLTDKAAREVAVHGVAGMSEGIGAPRSEAAIVSRRNERTCRSCLRSV